MVYTCSQVLVIAFLTDGAILGQADPAVLAFAFRTFHVVTATDLFPFNIAFRAIFDVFPFVLLSSLFFLPDLRLAFLLRLFRFLMLLALLAILRT